MSYKDINEKYRKILQEDSKRKQEEYQKEMNEITDANKKRALDSFKKAKKDVDKYMNQIQKGITNMTGDYMKGDVNWGWVGDMERLRKDLKDIVEYLPM